MEFRETNRREYLRQPHVIIIGIIILCVIAAALISGVRRVQQMQRAANGDVFDACSEFVPDEILCRFAASNQSKGSANSIVTTTTTNGEKTEVTTIEIESPDRMKSVSLDGLQEIEAYIILDAVTYVKDLDENIWAMYTDSEFTPSEDSVNYDFTSANAQDVIEFRDRYTYKGTESCDDRTCHKYEIIDTTQPDTTTSMWFDTEEFLLRKYATISSEFTSQTQFRYQDVKISAPSPTREVTESELEAYL